MQIESLIIYSRDGRRRELRFNLNGVSIIAGDSATGKSSLIEIVDYCLGSGECRVPDGTIRDHVEWYALKLVRDGGDQLLVGRRGPATGQRSTHQFHIRVGRSIEIPESSDFIVTHNLKDAVSALTDFCGIRLNATEMPDEEGANYDITIRHAIKFCLQYQDEIASKRTLFHQQGESFKAKAIYDSLPYLLGFQQDDYLHRLNQLKLAKRELAQAQRRIDEYEALAAGGLDIGAAMIAEAAEAGIISLAAPPTSPEQVLETLERVTLWSPAGATTVRGAADALTDSQRRLMELETRRQELRRQIAAAESATKLAEDAGSEWQEQVARLTSVGLFTTESVEARCPLCEQPTIGRDAELPTLRAVRDQLSATSGQLTELNAHLPELMDYIGNLRSELQQLDADIVMVQQTIRQLQRQRDERFAMSDLAVRQAFVVGRIDQYLTGMRSQLGEGAALQSAVAAAARRVQRFEAGISADDVRRRLRAVADQLQEPMTAWARELGLEFAGEPFRINFEQLTVEVVRDGYYLPLYRMGSGKNWLGCHLLAHFALHSYFIHRRRPVPRFLFLDQPTQVFYPPDDVDQASGQLANVKMRNANQSEDRDIVQRIFNWIFRQTASLNGSNGFQVIVTDHAELQTEQFRSAQIDLPRWRENVNSLVPPEWL